MKDLISNLPDSGFFGFIKKYWDSIEELFNSLTKFFAEVFKKAETDEPEE